MHDPFLLADRIASVGRCARAQPAGEISNQRRLGALAARDRHALPKRFDAA